MILVCFISQYIYKPTFMFQSSLKRAMLDFNLQASHFFHICNRKIPKADHFRQYNKTCVFNIKYKKFTLKIWTHADNQSVKLQTIFKLWQTCSLLCTEALYLVQWHTWTFMYIYHSHKVQAVYYRLFLKSKSACCLKNALYHCDNFYKSNIA